MSANATLLLDPSEIAFLLRMRVGPVFSELYPDSFPLLGPALLFRWTADTALR